MSTFKYILAFIFAAIYVCFGYFLERENFLHLSILFGVAFLLYFFLLFTSKDKKETDTLLWVSMVFRLIFIVAVPCLSTDFYRYLWDGNMILQGINPYLSIPSELFSTDIAVQSNRLQKIYENMGSTNHTSVGLPLQQLLFLIGGFFSKYGLIYGIVAIRIPILIAEFVTIKYLRKVLDHLQLPHYHVLWYALNPLVIVLLTGNLYLEGLMIMCMVIGIYWLMINRWGGAAIWWGMAIGSGGISLMFLPALMKRLGSVKSFWFTCITLSIAALSFIPFMDQHLLHALWERLSLYYQTTAFNAGIFYLIRWIGYPNADHDVLHQVMPMLLLIAMVLILFISFYKNHSWQDTLKKMFFAYTIFLLLSSAVFPSQLVTLILLSVFVKHYRFAMIWSALIIVSYIVYASEMRENYILIWLEYLVVLGWIAVELFKPKEIS